MYPGRSLDESTRVSSVTKTGIKKAVSVTRIPISRS